MTARTVAAAAVLLASAPAAQAAWDTPLNAPTPTTIDVRPTLKPLPCVEMFPAGVRPAGASYRWGRWISSTGSTIGYSTLSDGRIWSTLVCSLSHDPYGSAS